MKTLDALSVAPEVLDYLEQLGGSEVHLFAEWEKTLYVADLGTIRNKGVLASMHAAIGPRYHLSRSYWRITKLTYRIPYLEEVVTLHSYPEPVQLGLFEEGAS